MKTICITGASGFVGQHLREYLQQRDELKLRLLTRSPAKLNPLGKVEVIAGDILNYDVALKFIVKDAIVVHLAYLTNSTSTENLQAAENLARACIQNNASHFIHVSTAVVVGNAKENIITPETKCLPQTEYETTKLAIEKQIQQALAHHCPLTILRPTAIFGRSGKNLNTIIESIYAGKNLKSKIKFSLNKHRKMNLVAVENVVAAILFLMSNKGLEKNDCYIISDDDEDAINYAETVNIISAYLQKPIPQLWNIPFHETLIKTLLFLKNRSNTNLQRIYSSEKLMNLGFKKVIPLKEALLNYLAYYSKLL